MAAVDEVVVAVVVEEKIGWVTPALVLALVLVLVLALAPVPTAAVADEVLLLMLPAVGPNIVLAD